jgi:3-hydroxybutyryl-CoA dehydrogenase
MSIEAVGLLGAGKEAAALAQQLVRMGLQVRFYDIFRDNLRNSMARIEWSLRNADALGKLINVEPVQSLAKLGGADMVIEMEAGSNEDRSRMFSKLLDTVGESCVIVPKCGVEPVGPLVAGLAAPERFVGLNLYPPLETNKLAEVVRLPSTGDAALEAVVSFVREIGKTPVIAHDTPGVIVERLRRPFLLGALSLLENGRGFAREIDAAMRSAGGLAFGPFEMADFIGLDRGAAAGEAIYNLLGKPERLAPSAVENRLAQYGQLGRRSTVGFYIYDGADICGENPALRDLVPYLAISPAPPQDIFRDVMLRVAQEAKILAAESMLSEFDLETAAKLAFGWPKGPLTVERELQASAPAGQKRDEWGDAL